MRTTRWLRASIASLLALPAAAQQLPAPELVARDGPAPVVDGRIDEAEWKDADPFPFLRGEEELGRGLVRRTGRQLYLAFRTGASPFGLGLRLTFTDPVSGRANILLVTPLDPPRPPLTGFRRLAGRAAEPLSCATCDARFTFAPEGDGMSCELRVPLDLLEIAATEKTYAFSAGMWRLDTEQAVATYPYEAQGATVVASAVPIRAEGGWVGPPSAAAPPRNEAIALLEEMAAPTKDGPPAFLVDSGWTDGRRKVAPLAALEERARALIEAYPEYVSLETRLLELHVARGDFEGALGALDRVGAKVPEMEATARHVLTRIRLLGELGRFDEAMAALSAIEDQPGSRREQAILANLRDAWRHEQEIRRAEAARDDLPRVRLETSKGELVIELFEDDAPNGVANFISLAEAGFYDGTRFHWVSGGGSVRGGDPNSRNDDPGDDGYGGPGYFVEPEPGRRQIFPLSVVAIDVRGARRAEGSLFAIHLTPAPAIDGSGTVLGRVIAGGDVVRRLEHYDVVTKAEVLRKRDHPYVPIKRG
jgi:cyclophilin family peptidyl-prolyl cis-trans isomerase